MKYTEKDKRRIIWENKGLFEHAEKILKEKAGGKEAEPIRENIESILMTSDELYDALGDETNISFDEFNAALLYYSGRVRIAKVNSSTTKDFKHNIVRIMEGFTTKGYIYSKACTEKLVAKDSCYKEHCFIDWCGDKGIFGTYPKCKRLRG